MVTTTKPFTLYLNYLPPRKFHEKLTCTLKGIYALTLAYFFDRQLYNFAWSLYEVKKQEIPEPVFIVTKNGFELQANK